MPYSRLTHEQKTALLQESGVGSLLLDLYFSASEAHLNAVHDLNEFHKWYNYTVRTPTAKNTMFVLLPIYEERVDEAERRWMKYHRLLMQRCHLRSPDLSPSDLPTLPIEQAKSTPITEAVPLDKLRRSSSHRSVACCPVHDEHTPSFTIYTQENRAHCFGCGWHGDVIDLIQEVHQCDFKDAVKYLTNT